MSSSASDAAPSLADGSQCGRNSAVERKPVRPRASSATSTVSRTVSSGNRRAAWKVRPRPCRARRRAARAARRRRRAAHRAARRGTNPPIAFISVDFPAPLVPMSPTISSAPDVSSDTPSTATMPPKRTAMSPTVERRDAVHERPGRADAHADGAASRRCGGRRRRSPTMPPTPRSASRAAYAICMKPPGK